MYYIVSNEESKILNEARGLNIRPNGWRFVSSDGIPLTLGNKYPPAARSLCPAGIYPSRLDPLGSIRDLPKTQSAATV